MNEQNTFVILGASIVAGVIPALLTGDLFVALTFGIGFTLLFVLPLVPWMLMLKLELFEQIVLSMILGVASIPICYFVIGVLRGPLTLPIMLAIPALIGGIGLWRLLRKA